MKGFLFAMLLTAGIGMCASGLVRDTSSTSYKSSYPATSSTACSQRATARAQSECEDRCADKYRSVQLVAECRTRCAASAAMYLAGCRTSGGVLP